jgi:quinol monooxygenase YgiN
MIEAALLVRLRARPGKEQEVADFLQGARSMVEREPQTNAWFAVRLNESTFGIFDVFPDDAGRQAHLAGGVISALIAQAPELLSEPPSMENLDVLACKLPAE